jgi:DNA-binding NarL/FixJ family response regulator
MDPVSMAVHASDPITRDAATVYLQSCELVRLVPPGAERKAEVVLMLATEVTEETLTLMSRTARESVNPEMRILLVANQILEAQLMRAVKYGLVSLLLRQETSFDRVVQAAVGSRKGRADMPDVLVRSLIEQLRAMPQTTATSQKPTSVGGLTTREIDVVKLLAEGMDTMEVASKLSYSERTIKNILHGMMSRLGLRNRAHAVAFAMRSGLLCTPATGARSIDQHP